MPGRIIGISQDKHGKQALRMALQTREQHIRREKANSNICTAQSLLAVTAASYAIYHGPQGIKNIATRVNKLASLLATALDKLNIKISNQQFFDTITITGIDAEQIIKQAQAIEFNFYKIDNSSISIACDETTTPADISKIIAIFDSQKQIDIHNLEIAEKFVLNPKFTRSTSYLTAAIFNSYLSETAMMRYLKHLADKDIGLDRAMIPLGSCTMKLNAACEMIPVTWPEFGQIHPFAPSTQTQGYQQMLQDLEQMLCKITGYDAVSPNLTPVHKEN